jgi:arylsulfatase A-like enzyme
VETPGLFLISVRALHFPTWDAQPEEAKRVYRRPMENYSGFLDHTDAQVGRVIDAIATSGELDNTLVFYVVGDNGASGEGLHLSRQRPSAVCAAGTRIAVLRIP